MFKPMSRILHLPSSDLSLFISLAKNVLSLSGETRFQPQLITPRPPFALVSFATTFTKVSFEIGSLLGYEIPGQSPVGSLLNLSERDDVARAVSTTLLTREYRVTHASRNLRARIRKTHMTADMNMPQGLSQQSVHPSRKLKESIEAESRSCIRTTRCR